MNGNMNIVFFAARKLHKDYFSKLAQQIKQQSPQYSATVLWHKSLWQSLSWLVCLIPAFKADLSTLVEDHIHEKQNSRKGRLRQASYWPIFRAIKSFEACILFAIYYSAFKASKAQQLVIWNGLKFRQCIAIAAAEAQAINCLYMENGLLPGKTTLDGQGINFRNSVPRSADFFLNLNKTSFTSDLVAQLAKPLSDQFNSKPSSLPEHYIFIPFQVNTDSQVILFSPWIKDMLDLVNQLDQVSQILDTKMPNVVFKPHPACDQNYDGLIKQYEQHDKLHFDTQTPTPVLIQHADAVATINSTVGIESLLLNKKLITVGQAFYSIAGLTLAAPDQASLISQLQVIDSWECDQELRAAFFNYLACDYQINGRWQDANSEHLSACTSQLISLIEIADTLNSKAIK